MLTEQDLYKRVGPMLADGTPLQSLIDFEKRQVAVRTIGDPEIHELELNKIFAKSWVTVGHEAEIPNAGDYVSRFIGEDNVLVVRGNDGQVHILLNACAHRGMEISRVQEGNTATFKCPYHGWVFEHTGRLLAAPFENDFYPDWTDKSEYGLITARVATRHGIIFGTFGETVPSLEEYLGDLVWYIDYYFGGVEWEVVGPAPRFTLKANWKTLADQFAGDGYHTATLHRGLFEAMNQLDYMQAWNSDVIYDNVTIEQGHTAMIQNARGGNRRTGEQDAVVITKEKSSEDPLANLVLLMMQVFPCSTLSGQKGITANVGGMIPKGPGAYERWSVSLVPKGAPDEARKFARAQQGPDLIFADDSQQGPSMQRAAQGAVARRRLTFKYNSKYGQPNREGWPAPGLVYSGHPREDNQWNWWRHWFDVMTADD